MLYWQCECNPAAALADHLLLRGPDQWHSVTIAIMSLLGCETWQSVVGLHALFSLPRCAKPSGPGSGIFLAWRRGTTVQPGCANPRPLLGDLGSIRMIRMLAPQTPRAGVVTGDLAWSLLQHAKEQLNCKLETLISWRIFLCRPGAQVRHSCLQLHKPEAKLILPDSVFSKSWFHQQEHGHSVIDLVVEPHHSTIRTSSMGGSSTINSVLEAGKDKLRSSWSLWSFWWVSGMKDSFTVYSLCSLYSIFWH